MFGRGYWTILELFPFNQFFPEILEMLERSTG